MTCCSGVAPHICVEASCQYARLGLSARNSVTAFPPLAGLVQFMHKYKDLKTLITGMRTVAHCITSEQKQNEPFRARSYKANWLNATEN